jgi:hypothetical protein
MVKKSGSGSGIQIRDEQPRSYFRELRNHFFGLKCLNSLMRIRDGKNSGPGSGINIPDPLIMRWMNFIKGIISSILWDGYRYLF